MEKLRKIFGKINISWKFLIIFSVLIGIGVGVLNRIPILNNTSFQDIAIVLDMWIILAIFIIVNCKDWKEAVVKCFIFFLISQPLIYFTEVVINTVIYKADFISLLTLYFRNYYVGAGWLMWTFLTIPGAFIAYQIKKNNVLAAIVLSVATTYLSMAGTGGLISTILNHFPYHLLNSIICLVMAYLLIYIILTNKKERIISTIITTIGVITAIIIMIISSKQPICASEEFLFADGIEIVECVVGDENIATVQIGEDGKYINIYSSNQIGTTEVKVRDQNGKEYTYLVNSTSKQFEIQPQE